MQLTSISGVALVRFRVVVSYCFVFVVYFCNVFKEVLLKLKSEMAVFESLSYLSPFNLAICYLVCGEYSPLLPPSILELEPEKLAGN